MVMHLYHFHPCFVPETIRKLMKKSNIAASIIKYLFMKSSLCTFFINGTSFINNIKINSSRCFIWRKNKRYVMASSICILSGPAYKTTMKTLFTLYVRVSMNVSVKNSLNGNGYGVAPTLDRFTASFTCRSVLWRAEKVLKYVYQRKSKSTNIYYFIDNL